MFTLHGRTADGRRGTIITPHGAVETPCFMPVGTGGAMRGMSGPELESLGAQILLCNTYHLHLRPGETVVAEAGGLHGFIGWNRPIITDSGGFQVFSLAKLRDVTDAGVSFRSHIDGAPLFLGPADATRIQHALGSDIVMCFDECPASTASRGEIQKAVDRTLRWAVECKKQHGTSSALLFGIVQGGLHRDLREHCLQELIAIGFDGYAIGGLAVGESENEMYGVLDALCPLMPPDKPRYLMGVGKLEQLKSCIAKGIDLFDCVLPTREARHGKILMSDGTSINILRSEYIHDHTPIDAESPSHLSRTHLKSYLHYLLKNNERLGETIACMQNLGVTLKHVDDIRAAIS